MLNRVTPTTDFNRVEEEQGFDLREGIGFLWRQWMFISSIVGSVMFVSAIYEYTQTPRYTASALVLLDQQVEKAGAKTDSILTEVNLDFPVIESQLAII